MCLSAQDKRARIIVATDIAKFERVRDCGEWPIPLFQITLLYKTKQESATSRQSEAPARRCCVQ
jgi:hypothetical protein